MFSNDPRNIWGYLPSQTATYGMPYAQQLAPELQGLNIRIEELRLQVAQLTEIVRNVRPYGTTQWNMTQETSSLRFRETETHFFADFALPYIGAGDLDIEVVGNRVILQTRVPVAPGNRYFAQTAQMPRGCEIFELPDGRIELSWLVPVPFNAKEVEASFREGYVSIVLPKSEVTALRQPVKFTKETRRAAGMNS